MTVELFLHGFAPTQWGFRGPISPRMTFEIPCYLVTIPCFPEIFRPPQSRSERTSFSFLGASVRRSRARLL